MLFVFKEDLKKVSSGLVGSVGLQKTFSKVGFIEDWHEGD